VQMIWLAIQELTMVVTLFVEVELAVVFVS
jgi:hypothetical protein